MLCILCPPSVSICGMNEDMMTEQERTLTDPEAGQEGRGRGVFQIHTPVSYTHLTLPTIVGV